MKKEPLKCKNNTDHENIKARNAVVKFYPNRLLHMNILQLVISIKKNNNSKSISAGWSYCYIK